MASNLFKIQWLNPLINIDEGRKEKVYFKEVRFHIHGN
jgi:hypothetical protein